MHLIPLFLGFLFAPSERGSTLFYKPESEQKIYSKSLKYFFIKTTLKYFV